MCEVKRGSTDTGGGGLVVVVDEEVVKFVVGSVEPGSTIETGLGCSSTSTVSSPTSSVAAVPLASTSCSRYFSVIVSLIPEATFSDDPALTFFVESAPDFRFFTDLVGGGVASLSLRFWPLTRKPLEDLDGGPAMLL